MARVAVAALMLTTTGFHPCQEMTPALGHGSRHKSIAITSRIITRVNTAAARLSTVSDESFHPTDEYFDYEQSAAAWTKALCEGETLITRYGEIEASAEPSPIRCASHLGVGSTWGGVEYLVDIEVTPGAPLRSIADMPSTKYVKQYRVHTHTSSKLRIQPRQSSSRAGCTSAVHAGQR